MAEKNITEVQAIRNALAGQLDPETVAKLEHMIEVRSRKRERKPDTSKRDANVALGEQFEKLWDGDEFRISDVRELLNVNTARAIAIARAMEWAKVPTTETVCVYTLG